MQTVKMEAEHKAKWVTISEDEYESMKATIEVLSDPELMNAIKEGEDDIKKGRTYDWEKVKKELTLDVQN